MVAERHAIAVAYYVGQGMGDSSLVFSEFTDF